MIRLLSPRRVFLSVLLAVHVTCFALSSDEVIQTPNRPNRPDNPAPNRGDAFVGGPIAPDGTRIACDIPGSLHRRNTESHGLGLCVFTSIHHASLWQNVPLLQEFPKWVRDSNIPGGSYPEKTEQLVTRIAREKGMPQPDYIQVEDRDLEVLKLACKTGRMPSVTYSRSPTGRYNGQSIAHMVNIVHADDKWFVVLDNNYPGSSDTDKVYEWMKPQQFLDIYVDKNNGVGWSFILLSPPPPPRLVKVDRK